MIWLFITAMSMASSSTSRRSRRDDLRGISRESLVTSIVTPHETGFSATKQLGQELPEKESIVTLLAAVLISHHSKGTHVDTSM